MKHFKTVIKSIAIVFFSLILLFALFPTGRSASLKKANADSMDAYPGVCLGGWENPGNAAGTPDVAPGGTSFTGQNSAVLNGEQAQIFCGSFQASDQSQTPTAVTLHFSWNAIFASQAPATSVSSDTDTDSDSDSAAWSSVLDTTSTGAASDTDTSTQDQSIAPSSTPPAPPAPASSDDDSSSTVPASVPAPSSTPTPADVSQSSTSFLEGIIKDPFALLIQKTFAQTATDTPSSTIDTSTTTDDASVDTAGDFMDVSYSLDGTTWIDLGQVNMSDWPNYSVTIPVSSWSDINALQIELSPDISPDEPVVYLDGMWLEVDYNQSLLGALQDGATAAVNALSDLGTTVDNALTDLLPVPATSTAQEETPPPAADDTPAPPPPAPPAPPAAAQHQYSFILQGAQSIKVGKLAWDPENASGSAATSSSQGGTNSAPTVSLPATNTIQISGPCSSAYYTILIFPGADDYETNPSLALYNEANQCVGGNFTQTISDLDLPSQLASGTYYLIVANQGTKGPWVPDPEVYPIQLSATSNSTSSSQ